jgi:hypothetical protein
MVTFAMTAALEHGGSGGSVTHAPVIEPPATMLAQSSRARSLASQGIIFSVARLFPPLGFLERPFDLDHDPPAHGAAVGLGRLFDFLMLLGVDPYFQ